MRAQKTKEELNGQSSIWPDAFNKILKLEILAVGICILIVGVLVKLFSSDIEMATMLGFIGLFVVVVWVLFVITSAILFLISERKK